MSIYIMNTVYPHLELLLHLADHRLALHTLEGGRHQLRVHRVSPNNLTHNKENGVSDLCHFISCFY